MRFVKAAALQGAGVVARFLAKRDVKGELRWIIELEDPSLFLWNDADGGVLTPFRKCVRSKVF